MSSNNQYYEADQGISGTQKSPIIMAVCTDSSRCGGAVYADSVVHILADRIDRNDPYKGLDIMINKIQPEFLILSSVQKKLIDYIEKRFLTNISDISKRRANINFDSNTREDESISNIQEPGASMLRDGEIQPSLNLIIVANTWYSMSNGLQKLLGSEFVLNRKLKNELGKKLFITSKIDKSTDVCALRSIAALDTYIAHTNFQKSESELITSQAQTNSQFNLSRSQQSSTNLTDEPTITNLMPIIDIQYIDPGPVLSIDKFSLEALGIFNKPTRHYTGLNINDVVDKIPSLYEILNLCSSPQGKRQLHTIMMWPLQDIDEITRRHDTIDFFIRPENLLMRDQLNVNLKGVVPLANVIAHLSQAIGTYSEFATLYKALWSFLSVMDIIKSNNHNLTIFDRILELDSVPLRSAVDSIMNVVDFESSKKERRIQVCVGVDQEVDEKKEIIRNLAKFCDEVAVEETAKYRDTLRKICRVIYVPRIGFLNSIEYSSTSELMSIKTSKEFDVLLYTEQSVYFKTPRMEQLDAKAGDLACDLIDVQETVINKLQNQLLEHSDTILKLMDLCGELDCLIAFSIVSLQRGYSRPVFTPADEEIYIKQAYHPLHSTKCNIIPNDIQFYNDASQRRLKVIIVTGPNSCGKTTYMKTACLVIYMAHIGCFVPATHARMPIVDAILTRIHSANSVSTGLSSFATDVHQINYAIRKATNRSLIAIDEFGKGTLATDGFHLLKGLIIFFATKLQDSPYVIVSTHFNRLINHLRNYNEYILYKTFKVTRDPVKDTIIYDFQLISGVGDMSLADKVAATAGLPQHLIDRASQIRDYIIANRQIRPLAPRGA